MPFIDWIVGAGALLALGFGLGVTGLFLWFLYGLFKAK